MRRTGVLLAVTALVALPAGTAAAAPAGAAHGAVHTTGTLIPTQPGTILPVHGGTVDSLNWSGYAVTPGSGITAVSSAFTVPSVVSPVPPGFAATWTGIGGYNSSDLIQAGVGENSLPSNPLTGPQYYAWYEILPASETPLTNCTGDAACTVNPGDQVTVNITNAGGNNWTVALTDAGHWSWSQTIAYASSESSAEWILEAPTVGAQTILANTGTTHFGPTSTYTQGGTTHTIAQGNPTTIDLSPSPVGGVNEATPSALASDGQSFNDCAYAQTCPTP